MLIKLPTIYPITDKTLSRLSHAEQVARLIDGGASLIQLRDKHSPPKDFLRDAEAAKRIADQNNVKLIINDRVDIAMAIDAAGVHVGQSDIPVEIVRRLLNQESIVGFSTHTLRESEMAGQTPADYLAFGPIFTTDTKADREPAVGLELLKSAVRINRGVPLVAIGGISAENCRAVLAAGASSVAVISAAVGDGANITKNMRRLLDLTRL
jgi:thiamine-phosphate pyrophosphorylase